ncbi:CRYD protein, partial [Atrichornis clamosus]|nr:CRYD protein [Atrichornis clamosus]
QVDYDACSNYGNWLYSAGIGNSPRDNRKFNMIKQGLDCNGNGDYIQLWVPELQGIKGAHIHTPWALSRAALSQVGVTLGETYPGPAIHPAASVNISLFLCHLPQGGSPHPRGRRGPAEAPAQHKDRGTDFYFSCKKDV